MYERKRKGRQMFKTKKRYRIRISTNERLKDVKKRREFDGAEIARKAVAWQYKLGVKYEQESSVFTEDEATRIEVWAYNHYDGSMDQLINDYLDAKDTGMAKPMPTISEEDLQAMNMIPTN